MEQKVLEWERKPETSSQGFAGRPMSAASERASPWETFKQSQSSCDTFFTRIALWSAVLVIQSGEAGGSKTRGEANKRIQGRDDRQLKGSGDGRRGLTTGRF